MLAKRSLYFFAAPVISLSKPVTLKITLSNARSLNQRPMNQCRFTDRRDRDRRILQTFFTELYCDDNFLEHITTRRVRRFGSVRKGHRRDQTRSAERQH